MRTSTDTAAKPNDGWPAGRRAFGAARSLSLIRACSELPPAQSSAEPYSYGTSTRRIYILSKLYTGFQICLSVFATILYCIRNYYVCD